MAHALAGSQLALGCMFVIAALFFVVTARRRPTDGEYLFVALNCAVMTVYTAVAAWTFWCIGEGDVGGTSSLFDIAVASTMVAVPCMLQFVIRYTGALDERRIMSWSWGATVVFLGVLLAGQYWEARPTVQVLNILGSPTPVLVGRVRPPAYVFFVAVGSTFVLALRMLWRAYVAGRRECLTVMAGVGMLSLGGSADALAASGVVSSPPLLPLSFLGFVYLMSHNVLQRYAALTRELRRRGTQLERRSTELARSLAELERTQADLVHSEQLAVLGEFAAVITHEVRNPMQIVNNAVGTLRKIPQVTDHTRSLLGIIEDEMQRLERLVGHLLNYARPIVPQRRSQDIGELLSETIRRVYDEPDGDLEVALHCQGPWPTLKVDAEMMMQATANLVLNAVQAADGRGRLDVRVACRQMAGRPCVVIGFEDDGEGMSEIQVEQATSPFYTTRGGGTGLGLPICERIVEAHGGALHIASEPGAGTAVSMVLPIHEDVVLPSLDDLG